MKHTIPLDKNVFSQFLLAGMAEFTIVSIETGRRYSFKAIKCPQEKSTIPEPPIWVHMYVSKVSGTGRVALFMGTIFKDNDGLIYVHGRRRKHYEKRQGIQAFKWVFKHRDNVPETVEIYHVGKCSSCGKKLTTPTSIKNGLGPVCLKKIQTTEASWAIYDKHLTEET